MPISLLAGVPKPIGQRHRGYLPSISGWQVIVVPSPAKEVSVNPSWDAILQHADSADEAGAHILAFHSKIPDRGKFEKSVYGRHRLVWLDSQLLNLYGSVQFTQHIQDILDFEDQWRELIRPSNTRHALILPEPSFQPDSALSTAWSRVQRLVREKDSLERVSAQINAFRRRHYSNSVWQDRAGLVFDPGSVGHGEAKREWCWKYTYLVPAQFHFDVRAISNRGFQVRDRSGAVHSFTEYTNIDCHGVVRGGR